MKKYLFLTMLLASCSTPQPKLPPVQVCVVSESEPYLIVWGKTNEEAESAMQEFTCQMTNNAVGCRDRKCDRFETME